MDRNLLKIEGGSMPKKGRKKVFWEYLKNSKKIVLTTHIRPDGDGIASELALSEVLKSIGKEVYILNEDKTPEMYQWLPNAESIMVLKEGNTTELNSIDLAVLLDCSSRDRIGRVHGLINGSKRIISLDHHEETECYGDYCYIDTAASSIGEILYSLIPNLRNLLTTDIATCLYVSILTDTGSFAFSNTDKKVFKIVSQILDYGVKPDDAYQRVYNNKRIQHFKLLAKACELIQSDETGKLVYILLPLSTYREINATEEDNEGILEVIRGLRNLELIIMLRELEGGRIKVSLRSIGKIDCNYLAKLFGGGGHFKASGFVIPGDINISGHSVVEKIQNEVKRLRWV